MGTITAEKSTRNFMYFLYNFRRGQVEQMFNEATPSMANHFISKWNNYTNPKVNGTEALKKLFFDLSVDNQEKIIIWVNNNYKGIS